MQKFAKHMRLFASQTSGATALMFAVSVPALFAAVGVASDFAVFNMKKSALQTAADQSALSTAKELGLASLQKTSLQQTAANYALAALSNDSSNIKTDVVVDSNNTDVTVYLSEYWTPFFAHFIGADIMPVTAHAKASLQGESKICVLAVSTAGMGAVSMIQDANITAKGCSIYSNSTNAKGVYLGDNAKIDAALVCSAGGVYSTKASTASQVMTDCPKIADPLAARPTPKVGSCDFTKYAVSTGNVTLSPGVYCGGISITGKAKVTFSPGDYIVKDGMFWASDTAQVIGKDVGFYLTGALSLINFRKDATIDLSGREKGEMAGLLFFEDPKSSLFRIHNISASKAHTLTGTIYLPKGSLLVDPNSSVGEKSAYTAIIAQRLIVQNGPSLVLNTNYSATKVPVPAGIISDSQVVLVD